MPNETENFYPPTHFFRYRRHANQMRKLRNGMNIDFFNEDNSSGIIASRNLTNLRGLQVALVAWYPTHPQLDARVVYNEILIVGMAGQSLVWEMLR